MSGSLKRKGVEIACLCGAMCLIDDGHILAVRMTARSHEISVKVRMSKDLDPQISSLVFAPTARSTANALEKANTHLRLSQLWLFGLVSSSGAPRSIRLALCLGHAPS